MEPESYMGSARSDRCWVCVWVDAAGAETGGDYNLSDSTGPHPFRSQHGRRKFPGLTAEIADLRCQARAAANERRVYAQSRRRDTTEEHLRFAFLVTEGRGGSTIYHDQAPDEHSRTEGYGITPAELAEIDRLEIPYVDTRTIPDHLIGRSVSLPMPPSKPDKSDPAPYGPLSEAPIPVWAAAYAALGATVRHVDLDPEWRSKLRGWSDWEARTFSAFNRGDEIALGAALFDRPEGGV